MALCWDEEKRQKTLKERGLDFARCDEVLDGPTFSYFDNDHDEQRIVIVGFLDTKVVIIVRTEDEECTRIISMRKASRGERKKYEQKMG